MNMNMKTVENKAKNNSGELTDKYRVRGVFSELYFSTSTYFFNASFSRDFTEISFFISFHL